MESPHIYQIYHFSWFRDAQEKRCHVSHHDMNGTPCSLDVKTTARVSCGQLGHQTFIFKMLMAEFQGLGFHLICSANTELKCRCRRCKTHRKPRDLTLKTVLLKPLATLVLGFKFLPGSDGNRVKIGSICLLLARMVERDFLVKLI